MQTSAFCQALYAEVMRANPGIDCAEVVQFQSFFLARVTTCIERQNAVRIPREFSGLPVEHLISRYNEDSENVHLVGF